MVASIKARTGRRSVSAGRAGREGQTGGSITASLETLLVAVLAADALRTLGLHPAALCRSSARLPPSGSLLRAGLSPGFAICSSLCTRTDHTRPATIRPRARRLWRTGKGPLPPLLRQQRAAAPPTKVKTPFRSSKLPSTPLTFTCVFTPCSVFGPRGAPCAGRGASAAGCFCSFWRGGAGVRTKLIAPNFNRP